MTDGRDEQHMDYAAPTGADLDADLQRELDDALGEMSLLDLGSDMGTAPTEADQPGNDQDIRTGTVVGVHRDDILVDLGGKSTGLLPRKQLGDDAVPNVGDSIEVTVVGYNEEEGLIKLSRKDAVMAATWENIHVGLNVEGIVTGHNKGGLEIKVDGIKAFIPISQIDLERIESEDLPSFADKRLHCQVIEYNRSDRKLVLSRRKVLAQQAAEAKEKMLESLKEGQIVTGTVRTIMPYGAFVDIGGADGLLHVRDMGYARVEDPADVVSVGQQLELKVLKIDRADDKIALGLKQTLADPWTDAEVKWPVDSMVTGRIVKMMNFGAFFELTEGVDGLIPISEITFEKRLNHPQEMLSIGQVVEVRVMTVDVAQRRISLSLKRVGDDPWIGASVRWAPESVAEGVVTRIADFGAFVQLTPGVEGLVHISELSNDRVQNVTSVLQVGQTINTKVLSVDEDARRISLSIKQLAEMSDYTGAGPTEDQPERPKRKRKKPLKGGLDW